MTDRDERYARHSFYRIEKQNSDKVLLNKLCKEIHNVFIGTRYWDLESPIENKVDSSIWIDRDTLYSDYEKYNKNRLYTVKIPQ